MVGKLLAHFQILETLGEGGVGVVYKARDTNLGRPVAIKILTGDSISDPKRRHRFLQESKSASAVNHPNLVHIYEVGQSEGVDFIAMEYVSGQTLQQLIAGGDCAIPKIVDYAIQIVDGLGAAHAVGILHRDVKPANIMVHDENLIKILDFGLAKLWKSDSGNPIYSATESGLPYRDRESGRHGRVHVTGTSQRRGIGRTQRSVFAWRAALRVGHTATAFSRQHSGSSLRRDSEQNAQARAEHTPRSARPTGQDHIQSAGKKSGCSVSKRR